MKKEKRVIQVIIKSGLITWVLLLLIWQTGSLFYSDDFLPGPVTTFAGAGKLVASGELFRDILISMQRVLKGWLLGGNRLSDLHIKTLLYDRLDLYRYFYTRYHWFFSRQDFAVCGKKSIETVLCEIKP